MSYRKGEQSPKANERNCPYIVELPVPDGGLGKKLDLIVLFHANLQIPVPRGTGRYAEGRHYVRWCFNDLQPCIFSKSVRR
jgi:hypothetical protein